MNLKYYLFSNSNGELMEDKEFETKEELKEFIKKNKYMEDLKIIYGWEVKEEYV